MKTSQNPQYWIEKRAKRKTGYPIATIAYYGPDATVASKVVVAIFATAQAPEPQALQKWFTHDSDIRHDAAINQAILTFLDDQHVARVVMTDRLLGCPHEEGIDYSSGDSCPQCPYWVNRDRWTGALITPND